MQADRPQQPHQNVTGPVSAVHEVIEWRLYLARYVAMWLVRVWILAPTATAFDLDAIAFNPSAGSPARPLGRQVLRQQGDVFSFFSFLLGHQLGRLSAASIAKVVLE